MSILALVMASCVAATAQPHNLVLNPGFEQVISCPDNTPDNIGLTSYWTGIDTVTLGIGIPEFCTKCATGNHFRVPGDGGLFHQNAHGDTSFAHVQMGYDEAFNSTYKRDYLQGRLYQNLIPGQSYCVAFYVSLTEASTLAIDKIGAYIDAGIIDTTSMPGMPQTQYTPQIYNTAGILSDTGIWVKIKGTFIADGSEKFITIGNFYDWANTQHIGMPSPTFSGYSWYLVDDVSVIESNLPAKAAIQSNIAMVEGDSVFLGRTPEVGLECKWYADGILVKDGPAGFWAKPSATTTYVVEQDLCGLIKKDTAIVHVWPVSTGVLTQDHVLEIYPNPSSTEIIVKTESLGFNHFTITDNLGRLISSGDINSRDTKIDISEFSKGVYNITLDGPNGRAVKKVVRM